MELFVVPQISCCPRVGCWFSKSSAIVMCTGVSPFSPDADTQTQESL